MTNQQALKYAILLKRKNNLMKYIDRQYADIKTAQKTKAVNSRIITNAMDDLNKKIFEHNTQVINENFNREQTSNLLVKVIFLGF